MTNAYDSELAMLAASVGVDDDVVEKEGRAIVKKFPLGGYSSTGDHAQVPLDELPRSGVRAYPSLDQPDFSLH